MVALFVERTKTLYSLYCMAHPTIGFGNPYPAIQDLLPLGASRPLSDPWKNRQKVVSSDLGYHTGSVEALYSKRLT